MCDGRDGILGCSPSIKNTVTIVTTVTERKKRMKNIQIPYELFFHLIQYHLMDNRNEEAFIQKGLEIKLDAMVLHDLYGKSKTAPTEKEREKARKEYLDRRGMSEKFRW